MKEENIAIKTTAPSTEGLDIVDFLCKTYNVHCRFQNYIDEVKNELFINAVFRHANNGDFWIVYYKDCIEGKIINCVHNHLFQEVSDAFIRFDNFSDFKKYIEDMKEENEDMKEEVVEKKGEKEDKVNHPKHYTSHPSGVECIEITRHYCFSIGNAIKYLWRAGLKTEKGMEDKEKEIQDLKKAMWYINDRLVQIINARKIARFTPVEYTVHPSDVECEYIAQYYCESIRMAISHLWWCGLETNILLIEPKMEEKNLVTAASYINERIKQLETEQQTEDFKEVLKDKGTIPFDSKCSFDERCAIVRATRITNDMSYEEKQAMLKARYGL